MSHRHSEVLRLDRLVVHVVLRLAAVTEAAHVHLGRLLAAPEAAEAVVEEDTHQVSAQGEAGTREPQESRNAQVADLLLWGLVRAHVSIPRHEQAREQHQEQQHGRL